MKRPLPIGFDPRFGRFVNRPYDVKGSHNPKASLKEGGGSGNAADRGS